MAEEKAAEEIDDETLVLQIAVNQDKGALTALLKRYGPRGKGYLTKQFGDTLREPEIDQAMNDAAFNVWRFAERFDPGKSKFKSWFIRILQNAALSIIRAEKKHLARELEYDPEYDPARPCEEDAEGCAPDGPLVQMVNAIIDNELTGLEQAVARADRAVGGSADTARLADLHGKSMNNIYATRSKYREKIRRLVRDRQAGQVRPGRKT